jgi:hypothetical protein
MMLAPCMTANQAQWALQVAPGAECSPLQCAVTGRRRVQPPTDRLEREKCQHCGTRHHRRDAGHADLEREGWQCEARDDTADRNAGLLDGVRQVAVAMRRMALQHVACRGGGRSVANA